MSRRNEWLALTATLLVAAGLRFWGLGSVPPGPSHDEVANWLIAKRILSGDHAIYFTAAYGHEPLYQYVQAAAVGLFGDHWLGLRWPSVAFGLLGLAAVYRLLRYLFDARIALLTIAWSAVSMWSIFYARVAYRAISLPFVAALAAYFSLQVLDQSSRRAEEARAFPSRESVLAGLFLGLSLYTYTAARMLPFILAAVFAYSRLAQPRSSMALTDIAAVFLVGALVFAPLAVWLVNNQDAERRIAEVRAPLDRLLAGDLSLAWENLVANLKFFTFAGDPWPRYNRPGRPVFAEPVGALLFMGGLLVALWNWRNRAYGILLVWLIGSLGPSVVTAHAPSSIRDILGLVVTFAFPAIGLAKLIDWVKCKVPNLGTGFRRQAGDLRRVVPVVAMVPCLLLTVRDYFVRWPQDSVVRFDYQADLAAVGEKLDDLPSEAGVTVSGLSVHTMDGPSLELVTRREVASVRLADTRETLTLAQSPTDGSWVLVPGVVPVSEGLRQQLLAWGATEIEGAAFTMYQLSEYVGLRQSLKQLESDVTLANGSSVTLPVSFDGRLAFLGYRELDQEGPDRPLTLLTYWRVENPPKERLKIFAHLIDEGGEAVAQDDGLASPADRWRAGDIVVQEHILELPGDSALRGFEIVRLGLYEDSTGIRLPVQASDHLELDRGTRE